MLELVLSEKGEVVLLDDDPVVDVYNLSFDELQKKIIQAQRKNFSDDHTSIAFVRKRVIVANTRKHPNAISEANLTFAREMRSNIQYLTIENEKLAQNL